MAPTSYSCDGISKDKTMTTTQGHRPIRAIISGGGTGGHIFPAISIGRGIMEASPASEVLFVGAEGKMEMEKVPAAGFRIIGLPVAGLQRRLTLHNIVNDLQVPFRLLSSVRQARRIIRDFCPDICIGVGGYASAPLLYAAACKGVPTLIQEQNGFAGLTNKLLGKRADRICVAYEGMERFFPADRIVLTGNPIRAEIVPATDGMRSEAMSFYGLDASRKHLLVVGGSLGSRTLNNAVKAWIEAGRPGGEDVEVLWQCGKIYKQEVDRFMSGHPEAANIRHSDFLSRMDLAYAAADVVISRSGASSVSELCAARKAVVFVPSPNVAEDHQTHNAMALVRKDAAMMVTDADAHDRLMPVAMALLADKDRIARFEENAGAMARPDAAADIVNEVYGILGSKDNGHDNVQ